MTLFFLLWACSSDPSGADGSASAGTTTESSQPGSKKVYEPVPMGVEALPASQITAKLDATLVRCDGEQGELVVETIGHPDRVELDLLVEGVVHTVDLNHTFGGVDDPWWTFTGAHDCAEAEQATWVLRAYVGETQLDCAAHGTELAAVLAGAHDGALAGAGRPDASDCRDIAGLL